ncbi:MAG: UPF0182 family protein, partial [Microcystaceae cyanobacterium]
MKFKIVRRLGLILMGIIGLELTANLMAETLWYQELGYLDVFLTRLGWQLGLAITVILVSVNFLWYHFRQAQRLVCPSPPATPPSITPPIASRYLPPPVRFSSYQSRTTNLNLLVLLGLILILSLGIAALITFSMKTAIAVWTPEFTLPNLTTAITEKTETSSQIIVPWLEITFILATLLTGFNLWKSKLIVYVSTAILSLTWGIFFAGNWP